MQLKIGKFLYHTSMNLMAASCGLRRRSLQTSEGKVSAYISPKSNKPWLLFIHGFTGNKDLWLRTVSSLGSDFNFILVDLVGHGDSDAAKSTNYDFTSHARVLQEILEQLKISEVSIVANSMGCGVAAELSRQAPFSIGSSIYISPFGLHKEQIERLQHFRGDTIRPFTLTSVAEYQNFTNSIFVKPPWMPASVLAYLADKHVKQAQHIDCMFDSLLKSQPVADWLDLSPSPIAILADRKDKVVDMTSLENLPEPGSQFRLFWLNDFGHLPMLESPKLLATAINGLLASNAQKSGN